MDFEVAEQDPAANSERQLNVSWRKPHGMVGLSFFNFMMRMLTMGVYDFWGRTDVRKRIWSSVRLNDEPFVYTGTGGELFFGFLIIFGVLILPTIAATVGVGLYFGFESPYFFAFYAVIAVTFFFLFGIAVYRAQRYRLSRTRWRGIRGGLIGNSLHYAWTFFWTGVLIPLTLGWIVPWRSTKLQKIITDETQFGDRPFSFNGNSKPLYGHFAVLWFGSALLYLAFLGVIMLMVYFYGGGEEIETNISEDKVDWRLILMIYGGLIVAGIIYYIMAAWYRAKVFNHFADVTHFENAKFRGTATGTGLFMLGLTNALIAFFSLFILIPIVHARTARYFINNLKLDGTVPVDEILQSTQPEPTTGEGLAHALDIDAF